MADAHGLTLPDPAVIGGSRTVFPFFVGCGRSGTTLVRAMFDSHPLLAVMHESTFIPQLAERRALYERPEGFAADLFVDDLWRVGARPSLARAPTPDWLGGMTRDEITGSLSAPGVKSYPDAVRCIFDAYARRHAKERYADKTPIYVIHMTRLAELFPESRFVHIVRDGRDVALAVVEMPWGPRGLDEAALWWKEIVERGRQTGIELGPERYREIRYEDLLEDPEHHVRALCAFLDLPFDDGMLRYSERAERIVAETDLPHIHTRIFLPPTKRLRDWRTQMPRQDQEAFELIAGGLLRTLGYERGAHPASPAAYAIARRRQLTATTARLARKAKRASRAKLRRLTARLSA